MYGDISIRFDLYLFMCRGKILFKEKRGARVELRLKLGLRLMCYVRDTLQGFFIVLSIPTTPLLATINRAGYILHCFNLELVWFISGFHVGNFYGFPNRVECLFVNLCSVNRS